MSEITIKIVTPEKIYLEKTASMVVLPSVEGELGICANHIPLLANLETGFVKIYQENNITENIFINSGIIKFENNQAVILCEEVIDLQNLDKAEIAEKIANQNQEISNFLSNGDDKKLTAAQNYLNSLEKIADAI